MGRLLIRASCFIQRVCCQAQMGATVRRGLTAKDGFG